MSAGKSACRTAVARKRAVYVEHSVPVLCDSARSDRAFRFASRRIVVRRAVSSPAHDRTAICSHVDVARGPNARHVETTPD
jgi:hypothetical protein